MLCLYHIVHTVTRLRRRSQQAMDPVTWYALAIGGPLSTSIVVNLALLTFNALRYLTHGNLLHYLSWKTIFRSTRLLRRITWLRLMLAVLFIAANAVPLAVGVHDVSGFVRRSGVLSVVNMAPLFLGTQMNVIASGCGLSLRALVALHRWLGIMAIVQGLTHTAVALSTESSTDVGKFSDTSGIVVASIMVAFPLTSIIRRRTYEMFAAVHFGLAVCAGVFVYLHNPTSNVLDAPKRYVVAAGGCLGLGWLVRLGMMVYRNVQLGAPSSRVAVRTITFELGETSIPVEDAVHIHVRLPRPWNIRAGQYVYLTVPAVSHTAVVQSHPFYIAWWYRVNDDDYIVLIAQKQQGFTQKIFHMKDNKLTNNYRSRAFIDGPYGQEMNLDAYDNIVLFATGIGIAGQLSHVAQLLRSYFDCGVKTKRVTLFWQVDAEIQLGWVADRMQQLLELDEKSQVLHIYLFVVGGFVSREASATNFVNRGKRIVVTYKDMDAAYLTDAELGQHGGRTVISLCADPQIVDRVRDVVQRRGGAKVRLICLDFGPDSARRPGLCLA
ncbi:FAD-binding domain-containing protein [Verticillium dahliae VdLs.17]|uniref:ferric-chelate reductase (NADPH) n=1 Tax=Verticillium dahliae (strain VdLs.17 / ATCC MYA-4575 / FGSC 10137) TaxID=498257 RepID=G2XFS4_VERDV|nr:FAD-binding domain-containing protein [Verticillium dahliae VdLs.17]EGY18672.1 FAD-binding domain-containing protein [Verticillium dahliae VdLs.17]